MNKKYAQAIYIYGGIVIIGAVGGAMLAIGVTSLLFGLPNANLALTIGMLVLLTAFAFVRRVLSVIGRLLIESGKN